MKNLLRHMFSCGQSAGRSWPLLLAVALSALWAAPAQAEGYGLYICGVQVTDENKDDLSVIPGVTGTVTYDPTLRVLRLKSATLKATSNVTGIYNSVVPNSFNWLFIHVEGACKIESKGTGISISERTIIVGLPQVGACSLTISSSESSCIYVGKKASCTIQQLYLTATGKWGIVGNKAENLIIHEASVRAKGEKGSICGDFESVEVSYCRLLAPDGAAFDGGTLKKDGKTVTAEAVIGWGYGLYVCGVQVTDANKDYLSSTIAGVTGGTVTYDPPNKVLRLKSATMETTDSHCIWNSSVDGLTIEVEGKSTMKSEKTGISLQAMTVIKEKPGTAASSLTVSSSGNSGIYMSKGAACTISGLDLTATGKWGIAGKDGASETLTIKAATVRATGTSGSICDFKSVTLSDCHVETPRGAAFDGGTLKKDGKTVTGEVLIDWKAALKICGVQVTDANKDKLVSTAVGARSGTITYDPTNRVLRLKDAVMVMKDDYCIENVGVAGLTIEVEGKCRMESSGEIGVDLNASTVIKGLFGAEPPSLDISSGVCGIYVNKNVSCTISSLDLAAKGMFGILAADGMSATLAIKAATVRATGTEGGSIRDFKSVTLSDCEVLTPSGAAFVGGTLEKGGKRVTGEAVIGRKYPLYIADVQVTGVNKDDLSAIAGVERGTISFNPSSSTLRLKDAAIRTAGHPCIDNVGVSSLSIEVDGTCRMESNQSVLRLNQYTTVIGKFGAESCSLALASSGSCGIYLLNGAGCTIRRLDLTATGKWGIAGDKNGDDANETLSILEATVRATGALGSICDFKSVRLDECVVVTPSGAAFVGGTLEKGGKTVTEEAVILPNDHPSVGIGTTAVDAPRREGVYTLSGVRLATPFDQLPRGVYVVDGRKVVKK